MMAVVRGSSTFAGYFPAEDPKYSCIVVIHEPDKSVGYYGADVSGPVFKSIARKIYANNPLVEEIADLEPQNTQLDTSFSNYFEVAQKEHQTLPNLKGMSGMDAVALLENMGIEVHLIGNGKVKRQSVAHGTSISKIKKIVLELS